MTSNTDPVVRLYEFLYLGKTDIASGIEKPTVTEPISTEPIATDEHKPPRRVQFNRLSGSLLVVVATVLLVFTLGKWASWVDTTESDTVPERKHVQKAQKLCDDHTWQEAITQDTADSHAKYLTNCPEGKYIQQAQMLYDDRKSSQEAITQDTADSYAKYLNDFPEGQYVQQAQRLYDEKISKLLRDSYFKTPKPQNMALVMFKGQAPWGDKTWGYHL